MLSFAESAIVSYNLVTGEISSAEDDAHIIDFISKMHKDREVLISTIEIITTLGLITTTVLSVFYALHNEFLLSSLQKDFSAGENLKVTAIVACLILSIALLYWVFGLLIPRALGEKYSQVAATRMARLIVPFMTFYRIPILAITAIANFFVLPFGVKTGFSSLQLTEEKIRALLVAGLEAGTIDKTEHEILQNVFEFTDLIAREVMIPRTEMVAVELTGDSETDFNEIIKIGHSLIPVFTESQDNIVGIIHVKDLIKSYGSLKSININTLIRPAYFVPETKPISQILREMQRRGERLTIVTDEYGGTEGVITLEDIISEIVGDLSQEGENSVKEYTKLADGNFLVLGSMALSDFNEVFNYEMPESEEYNTVAGFVSSVSGKILNIGEKVEFDNLEFLLIKKLKQKMVQFKVTAK